MGIYLTEFIPILFRELQDLQDLQDVGFLNFEFMFFKVQRACSDLSETVMFIEKESFALLSVATNSIIKAIKPHATLKSRNLNERKRNLGI